MAMVNENELNGSKGCDDENVEAPSIGLNKSKKNGDNDRWIQKSPTAALDDYSTDDVEIIDIVKPSFIPSEITAADVSVSASAESPSMRDKVNNSNADTSHNNTAQQQQQKPGSIAPNGVLVSNPSDHISPPTPSGVQPSPAQYHSMAPMTPMSPISSTSSNRKIKIQGQMHPQNRNPTQRANYKSVPPSYSKNRRTPASQTKQQGGGGGSVQWSLPMMPNRLDERIYFQREPDFVPTWGDFLQPRRPEHDADQSSGNEPRAYVLSLLSQNSFTVTAVPHYQNSLSFAPNLNGLRIHIKKITKSYGNGQKAVFEKITNSDGQEEGRWRIPISAYYAFNTYLRTDPRAVVDEIPEHQLKIASLGRTVSERGYPPPEELIKRGVPTVLAKALAPYQRGGVDFALLKEGRCLLADDMGLGKTVQSIASMSCYMNEWPLFILTPSSARYHWMNELVQWLGKPTLNNNNNNNNNNDAQNQSTIEQDVNPAGRLMQNIVDKKRRAVEQLKNKRQQKVSRHDSDDNHNEDEDKDKDKDKDKDGHEDEDEDDYEPLKDSQINVITKSKDLMFPNEDTRVVICSYGLATNLIQTGAVYPGLFRCIIVDESHMLKSNKSKRTIAILPLLKAASRVMMLSGTPAFSKPYELYPQLSALLEHMWTTEEDYVKKYCQGTSNDKCEKNDQTMDPNLAELHTMLKSTVMIRRTKAEVLKNLPGKVRESAVVKVRDVELREEITQSMRTLRECRGILGRLSRQHHATNNPTVVDGMEDGGLSLPRPPTPPHSHSMVHVPIEGPMILPPTPTPDEQKTSRKAILGHVFKISGSAKIPIIIDMLDKFLSDPTSGKLCIFGHHIHVIDAIVQHSKNAGHRFMSITGMTPPRVRQENISEFQTDPLLRVAILGITAAGVGVTLTAASTIWFAELFWTPAILIQAEDRCHRIGQQAKVHCLYLIAEGTLDEVLWLLVKKKFRDLGEFVEGKEKLDIVVHRHYEDEWSAIDRVCGTKEDEDEGMDGFGKLEDEDLIEGDMEEMASEERAMEKVNSEDEDDAEVAGDEMVGSVQLDATLQKLKSERPVVENDEVDSSETDAVVVVGEPVICLSDDEGEDIECRTNGRGPIEISHIIEKHRDEADKAAANEVLVQAGILPSVLFPGMQFYTVSFNDKSYGLALAFFSGRIVVQSTPAVGIDVSAGSVIAAVNNQIIPHNTKFSEVMNLLKFSINTPPVVITFAEDKEFEGFWIEVLQPGLQRLKKKIRMRIKVKATSASSEKSKTNVSLSNKKNASNVIELLDDD